jgi:hypothetical protein
MMDGGDNSNKSMSFKASCAIGVQYDTACCVYHLIFLRLMVKFKSHSFRCLELRFVDLLKQLRHCGNAGSSDHTLLGHSGLAAHSL